MRKFIIGVILGFIACKIYKDNFEKQAKNIAEIIFDGSENRAEETSKEVADLEMESVDILGDKFIIPKVVSKEEFETFFKSKNSTEEQPDSEEEVNNEPLSVQDA